MNSLPLVSLVIVGWNSRLDLEGCLSSLYAQTYEPYEVIVVDNASTDGTVQWLAKVHPDIRLLCNVHNQGFAHATNQGFAVAHGEILIGLNPDTLVTPNWLHPLVEALCRPGIGLATPRIMLMEAPSQLNAYGNSMSLTGLTSCLGIGELAEAYHEVRSVPALSGAAFAMTRTCYQEVGGFDPHYFTYFEDTELSWRVRLANYDIVAVGTSVIYHRYKGGVSPRKLYWLERNRLWTFLKYLEPTTWVRLAPALLVGELFVWGFVAIRGPAMITAKIRSYLSIWYHWDLIRTTRADVRLLRKVNDDAILRWLTPEIPMGRISGNRIIKIIGRLAERGLRMWQRIALSPSTFPSNQIETIRSIFTR